MRYSKKLLTSTLFLFWATKLLSVTSNFFVIRILTRNLSLGDYGEYSLYYSALLIFSTLFDFGSSAILIRYYPVLGEKIISLVITTVFCCSVVLACVYSILTFLFFRDNFPELMALGLTLFSNTIFVTSASIHLAKGKPDKSSIYIFGSNLIYLLGIVTLNIVGVLSVPNIFWMLLLSNTVSGIFVVKYFNLNLILSEFTLIKTAYAYGWPLAISSFLSVAFNLGDRYIVSNLLSKEAVAIYTFSFFVVNSAFQFLLAALNGIGEPKFWMIYDRSGPNEAFAYRHHLQNAYLIFAFYLTLALFYSRNFIVFFLAKSEYSYAGNAMLFYSLGFIIYGLFLSARYRAQTLNRNTIFPVAYLIGSVIKIIIDFVLIPAIGLLGALAANLIGYVCLYVVLLTWYLLFADLKWLWNRETISIFFLGAVLLLLALTLPTLASVSLIFTITAFSFFKLNTFASIKRMASDY